VSVPSGTGKTHLLTGLAVAACRQKRRVRFTTAAGLVNELVEAKQQLQLGRVLARWARYDLIALDEVGYVPLDEVGYVPLAEVGAEFLFQVIAERAEKAAVILTTNLPFSEAQVAEHPLIYLLNLRRSGWQVHCVAVVLARCAAADRSELESFRAVQGQKRDRLCRRRYPLAISRAVAIETAHGWRIAKEKQSYKIYRRRGSGSSGVGRGAARAGARRVSLHGRSGELTVCSVASAP